MAGRIIRSGINIFLRSVKKSTAKTVMKKILRISSKIKIENWKLKIIKLLPKQKAYQYPHHHFHYQIFYPYLFAAIPAFALEDDIGQNRKKVVPCQFVLTFRAVRPSPKRLKT